MGLKDIFDVATWLGKNWARLRPWITPQAFAGGVKPIPKNTFRIVLDTAVPPWWHMAKAGGGEPATQVHAVYYVTNITNEEILVAVCKLKPTGTDQFYHVNHFSRQLPDEKGRTATIKVSVDGIIQPAITSDGETLEAEIFFVDQFGNENPGPVTSFEQN